MMTYRSGLLSAALAAALLVAGCENDGGTAFVPGAGLADSGGEIYVDFGGTGSSDLVARSDHHHDDDYVIKSGDVMTGALLLPANGLAAGTDQFVLHGGNVGIGTAEPASKLDVVGDIAVSGAVSMGSEPSEASHAATKAYVDTGLAGRAVTFHIHDDYVNKTGDVMTGALVLPPPSADSHAATKGYVDAGLAGKAGSVHVHSSLSASDGDPAQALVVDAAGNVGINAPIPSARLDVGGQIKSRGFPVPAYVGSAYSYTALEGNGSTWINTDTSVTFTLPEAMRVRVRAYGGIDFWTNATETPSASMMLSVNGSGDSHTQVMLSMQVTLGAQTVWNIEKDWDMAAGTHTIGLRFWGSNAASRKATSTFRRMQVEAW